LIFDAYRFSSNYSTKKNSKKPDKKKKKKIDQNDYVELKEFRIFLKYI